MLVTELDVFNFIPLFTIIYLVDHAFSAILTAACGWKVGI